MASSVKDGSGDDGAATVARTDDGEAAPHSGSALAAGYSPAPLSTDDNLNHVYYSKSALASHPPRVALRASVGALVAPPERDSTGSGGARAAQPGQDAPPPRPGAGLRLGSLGTSGRQVHLMSHSGAGRDDGEALQEEDEEDEPTARRCGTLEPSLNSATLMFEEGVEEDSSNCIHFNECNSPDAYSSSRPKAVELAPERRVVAPLLQPGAGGGPLGEGGQDGREPEGRPGSQVGRARKRRAHGRGQGARGALLGASCVARCAAGVRGTASRAEGPRVGGRAARQHPCAALCAATPRRGPLCGNAPPRPSLCAATPRRGPTYVRPRPCSRSWLAGQGRGHGLRGAARGARRPAAHWSGPRAH